MSERAVRTMMRLAGLVLILGAGACDRTHLSSSFGQATRRALKAQVMDPAAGERTAKVQGLDPEEAGIVAKNYRESLTTKKEDSGRMPLIVMPTNQPGASVPMPMAPVPPSLR